MKKLLSSLVLLGVCIFGIQAQSESPVTPYKSAYFEVTSDLGIDDAALLAREMDLMFEVFNHLFRFDTKSMPGLFRVKAFGTADAYNNYVVSQLGRIREGAIYLHYIRPERRELIVHRDGGTSHKLLAHQAFIQFIRGFIPYPPSWMREGFAIFFSTLEYSAEKDELTYEENLAWLETVKSWGAKAPSMESILLADIDGIPEHFQPASWAMVSFLLNSGNEDYMRTLFESFMLLTPKATAAENTLAVMQRMSSWLNSETMKKDYSTYFTSRRTFAEFIEEGRAAYVAKEPLRAELLFLGALDLRPSHYAPYYYLGLLAYEAKNYDIAEQYYRSALQYGADTALLQYALGLNALSAGRIDDARYYLRQASEGSPERYKPRVEELLKQLN